ncbi:MAG: hypothetical protein LBH25_12585 [Fibromonadaceae bacterium]|jgi:uncharacterized protein (TIGR02145 family)|nr:hypothetical protein [Fibromonadaceae bacterium]
MIAKLSLSTAFLALSFLTIFGCNGVFSGSGDDMPCLTCPDSYYEPSSSSRQSVVIPGVSVSHGGETYETVVIGTQTWFKRNLNYNPSTGTSVCYNNESSNCSTYGRLYDWSTAMGLDASCNSTFCSGQVNAKHRGICPSGWHIPNDDDWNILMDAIGGSSTAGGYLKATSGWNSGGNGEDTYGFSALPGGYGSSGGGFSSAGDFGSWWSASENSSHGAYGRYVYYYYEDEDYNFSLNKSFLHSVRCVQD